MLLDLRIDEIAEMSSQPFVRALLIRPHQPRIAGHIGGEDRGETTGGGRGGHCWATITPAANLTYFARELANFIWDGYAPPNRRM
jgi:hypothetical protein